MIDKGANPFIVGYGGETEFEIHNLANLSNLPTQKSVFFTTRPLEGNDGSNVDFLDPWFYRTGVFDGKFGSVIGQGASGIVISGQWYGKKAAFKFVEIGTQKFQAENRDALKSLDEQLSEMSSIQATKGSKIVSFFGHYRYIHF